MPVFGDSIPLDYTRGHFPCVFIAIKFESETVTACSSGRNERMCSSSRVLPKITTMAYLSATANKVIS